MNAPHPDTLTEWQRQAEAEERQAKEASERRRDDFIRNLPPMTPEPPPDRSAR